MIQNNLHTTVIFHHRIIKNTFVTIVYLLDKMIKDIFSSFKSSYKQGNKIIYYQHILLASILKINTMLYDENDNKTK